MLSYILRRCVYMVIIMLMLSIVSFIIIQLPPGDFVDFYVAQLQAQGIMLSDEGVAALRRQYSMDLPFYQQYCKWIGRVVRGDFGVSFRWKRPVKDLLAETLPITVTISLVTLFFTYAVAIPIGIYSATHQYSIGDYSYTVLGFIGLAMPNFLLALILMFIFYKYFGFSIGGLFSPEYMDKAWSAAKIIDMFKHLPIPVVVVGTAGTAELIRIMRGCLLDELRKQYVITARAKGVAERTLLLKYPVRVAINPLISRITWVLPEIVSGATITGIVLSLPTTGPLLYGALQAQDMYLAGSIIMMLSFLTVIGTFISDILLVLIDPRIRITK
ncbi:MAG: ABC transporter permease [Spirochaetota bacterium]